VKYEGKVTFSKKENIKGLKYVGGSGFFLSSKEPTRGVFSQ